MRVFLTDMSPPDGIHSLKGAGMSIVYKKNGRPACFLNDFYSSQENRFQRYLVWTQIYSSLETSKEQLTKYRWKISRNC
jgi:hypothetical protein